MADVGAAKRYAQAAFELVQESGGSLAQWRSDLNDVALVLAESDVAPVFADGRIPLADRVALVDRVLEVQPLVANLAKLLIAKGRSVDARAVANAFGRLADESEGVAHAQVITAVRLTAAQLAAIERRLSASFGRKVMATSSVDPTVLGGLIVRVGDKLIDGSVRTRLRRLRQELAGAV